MLTHPVALSEVEGQRVQVLRLRSARTAFTIPPIFYTLCVAGCSRQPTETPQNLQQTRPVAAQAAAAELIPCARGTAPLMPVCTLERERTATGQRWTLRFPDGAFRRLVVTGDQIETADGAELLRGRGSDATVADEHYRLPTR